MTYSGGAWHVPGITPGGGTTTKAWQFPVGTYGAVGNARYAFASITTGSAALTSGLGDTFSAAMVGQTIRVDGAGVAGASLITTIAGFVDANHVTLAANASTTVANASTAWGTDDTAAIQAAITAAFNYAVASPTDYAEVLWGNARYLIAGALQSGVGAGYAWAQLYIPYAPESGQPEITLAFKSDSGADVGEQLNWMSNSIQGGGAELVSINDGAAFNGALGNPAVLGIINSFQAGPAAVNNFSNCTVFFDNFMISLPSNPNIIGLDLRGANEVRGGTFACRARVTHGNNVVPTGQSSMGLALPVGNNANYSTIARFSAANLYNALLFYEHTVIDSISIQQCVNGLCSGGSPHASWLGNVSVEWTKNVLQSNPPNGFSGGGSQVNIAMLDIEDTASGNFTTTNHIADNGAQISGEVYFVRVLAGTGTVQGLTVQNGAGGTKLRLKDCFFPPGNFTPQVPAASTATAVKTSGGTQVFRDVLLSISGGVGVAVSVDGVAQGQAAGTFVVPSNRTYNLGPYTAAPTIVATAL